MLSTILLSLADAERTEYSNRIMSISLNSSVPWIPARRFGRDYFGLIVAAA
jgi:hypothetical protein